MPTAQVELLEKAHEELKSFLKTSDFLKEAGPVQDIPSSSRDYNELGLRILVPLPWIGNNNLAIEIMNGVEGWAKKRGLEGFGYVWQGQVPLLLIGLRQPVTPTTS